MLKTVWAGVILFIAFSFGSAFGQRLTRQDILRSALSGVPQQTITWGTRADSLNRSVGQRFTLVCPAGGTLSSRLWGTDVYTDDSSICTAAVHAGLITRTAGGIVVIEIRPGQTSYRASTRHGVTSRGYGRWHGSFALLEGRPGEGLSGVETREASWSTHAGSLRGRYGERFTYICPGGGSLSSRVWGTDLYTADSSICSAAVHAGLITTAAGGIVTIEIRPGAGSYHGSTRHGVTSKNYGSYTASFVFFRKDVDPDTIQSPPCSNRWMELRPGTLTPGPLLQPGRHRLWIGAKDPRRGTITRWTSSGPFQIDAGSKYLAVMNDGVVNRLLRNDAALGQYQYPGSNTASIYYANRAADGVTWYAICTQFVP